MKKSLFIISLLFILVLAQAQAQSMRIGGNVQDTLAKAPLQYAVAIAVRIKDSLLVAFTRTNSNGLFEMNNLPLDTYQVVISHPLFADQSFYVFSSKTNYNFDFGKIVLPPKNHTLNEVVIYAFKDPIYYRGDTLVYTADSFKVKKNGTVEDLLKKLPGIKVDAQGKITAQGKKVDQVLVDGDEFFGNDPTIATKNLSATDIESVQVYDKKNDNAAAGAEDEALKIMNLKLKEEAKKGYFGKISGAGDFNRFYEGELLANNFNAKRKVSVFGLGSNTPRSNFGWEDMYKFGLFDMNPEGMSDDGGYSFSYSYEDNGKQGIPQTLKGGLYYSDKWSKKNKTNINYSYNTNELDKNIASSSQYFLSDTNYVTNNTSSAHQQNDQHSLDIKITQTLDSLTELIISAKSKFGNNSSDKHDVSEYAASASDALSRRTLMDNVNSGTTFNNNSYLMLNRSFKKKDRKLFFNYGLNLIENESSGTLQSRNEYYTGEQNDSINQKKISDNITQTHTAAVIYTEPLNKKIKLEFSYEFLFGKSLQNKQTLNYANGNYSDEDSLLSNNFENIKNTNSIGSKFIYEAKKHRLSIGGKFRQTAITNNNLITGEKTPQELSNVLPSLSYRYKFSDNQNLSFSYFTNSKQPDISQLQPVPDNSNTNQVRLGNPNLLPSYTHKFHLGFGSFKPITDRNIWCSADYAPVNNAFSNSITYDTIGRTVTMPINVNGNYTANSHLSFELPIFKGWMKLEPGAELEYNNNTNYINSLKNTTTTATYKTSLDINKDEDEFEITLTAEYEYHDPKSTLNSESNKPYSSMEYSADVRVNLSKKLVIETDANYHTNSQLAQDYNIDYLVWNASISRNFLKTDNLIISLNAYDILNQNINTRRYVQDNVITDTKTNIISRYLLFKAVLKFNNKKTKEEEDEFD